MERFNFKNLFRLGAVNRFFEDLLEKEIPGLVLDYAGSGSSLKGLEIVEKVGKTAEQKKIVISRTRIYIHECYVIYLAPSDYRRFAPLFPELETDIHDHLEQLKTMRHYQTKGRFEIQFLESDQVPDGRCQVVSTPKKVVAQTVLQFADLPAETPISWENSVFELDRDQDKLLKQVFLSIDEQNMELAIKHLNKFNRDFPKMTVGKTLFALVQCMAGNLGHTRKYILDCEKHNGFPLLREIKSLLIAMEGDIDRAESNLVSSDENPFNDISLFVASLLHSFSGRQKKADGLLSLALAMNSDLGEVAETVFGASYISEIRKQTVLEKGTSHKQSISSVPDHSFRLVPPDGGPKFTLVFGGCLDLVFPESVSRLSSSYFRSAGALCPPGFTQVSFETEAGQLLISLETRNKQVAEPGTVFTKDAWSWHYKKQVWPTPLKRNSKRNVALPCHILEIRKKGQLVETWFFPEDIVVMIGRESGVGNDWVLNDRSITGTAHGEWRYHEGELSFFDLNSSNGTAKNGKRFSGSASMNQGDLIQIGKASFEIQVGGRNE